jgi:hypothetical protein
VSHVGLCLLSLALSLFNAFTKEIQNAFLGNDPKVLRSLFADGSFIPISLPSPIGFSDQVSEEQAYFLFRRIFAAYPTSAFYPESDILRSLDRGAFIYKARWEFLISDRSLAFQILFYVRSRPPGPGRKGFWKIAEIRATQIDRLTRVPPETERPVRIGPGFP